MQEKVSVVQLLMNQQKIVEIDICTLNECDAARGVGNKGQK